ncbi:MAG: hypothetical protein ACK5ME_08120 [Parahaliea sp.]
MHRISIYILIILLTCVQVSAVTADILTPHPSENTTGTSSQSHSCKISHIDDFLSLSDFLSDTDEDTLLTKNPLFAQSTQDHPDQPGHCHCCHCHGIHLPLSGFVASISLPPPSDPHFTNLEVSTFGHYAPILRPPII